MVKFRQMMVAKQAAGKKVVLDDIMPQVYDELHRLASSYMRAEREGHTLQPTALVHEAYLRLMSQHSVDFNNRSHLLGIAAQMMRRILHTHEEKPAREQTWRRVHDGMPGRLS